MAKRKKSEEKAAVLGEVAPTEKQHSEQPSFQWTGSPTGGESFSFMDAILREGGSGPEVEIAPTMREYVGGVKRDTGLHDQILKARNEGNDCVEFDECHTTIDTIEGIKYSKSLGLKSCIRLDDETPHSDVNKYIKAGADEFIVNLFGRKELTGADAELMSIISKEKRFRVNVFIDHENCEDIEKIAMGLSAWDISIVSFLMVLNGIRECGKTTEGLNKAISILMDRKIGVNVYNWPMCWIDEKFRMCIGNNVHLLFDPYWPAKGITPKTHEKYMEVSETYETASKSEKCSMCGLRYCCGGIPNELLGLELERPVTFADGEVVFARFYYRKRNVLTMTNPYPEKLPRLPEVDVTSGVIEIKDVRYKDIEFVPVPVENLRAVGLPDDFGPGHSYWGIPSKMSRYKRALKWGKEDSTGEVQGQGN